MKKAVKVIVAVIAACALLAGGYLAGQKVQISSILSAMPKQSMDKPHEEDVPRESIAPDSTPPSADERPANDIADRVISGTDASAVDESWSKVSSSATASSGETLTLYTSAQTEDGEIIWDDSQKWVIEASDGSGTYYTLYDQLVTNGSVYYDIMQKENGEQLINVYTVTGAGTTIMQYTKTETGYNEKSVYNSGSVNRLFSSIPSYD